MILRISMGSPFARKVRIAAMRAGLMDRIELALADTGDPNDALRADNPLGKVPLLVMDDGRRVYDSRVIVECFDHLAGGDVLLPRAFDARLAVLTTQALGDGVIDAAVLMSYEERYRAPEMRSARWLDHQRGKIERGLAALLANTPDPARVDAGSISVACMLGYLDRRRQVDWRSQYPGLIAWLEAFRTAAPEFDATERAPDA